MQRSVNLSLTIDEFKQLVSSLSDKDLQLKLQTAFDDASKKLDILDAQNPVVDYLELNAPNRALVGIGTGNPLLSNLTLSTF